MTRWPLTWLPIDDVARNGRGHLVRLGNQMAVAMWNGERFVFPASYGRQLDFEPAEYYLPGGGNG